MTDEERVESLDEDERFDELFAMALKFEELFSTAALDLGVSFDDCDFLAAKFLAMDAPSAKIYGAGLSLVRSRSILRDLCIKFQTVTAVTGKELLTMDEVVTEFNKLPKGDA